MITKLARLATRGRYQRTSAFARSVSCDHFSLPCQKSFSGPEQTRLRHVDETRRATRGCAVRPHVAWWCNFRRPARSVRILRSVARPTAV